jgi:hypothetical protein
VFLLGHGWTWKLLSPVSVINVATRYSRPSSPPLLCLGRKTLCPSYHIASWNINTGVSKIFALLDVIRLTHFAFYVDKCRAIKRHGEKLI